MAAVLLSITLLALRGAPWPTWASPAEIGLLGVSGLIGFVFGDAWFFRALVILGPGRAALLASLAPLFTMALAWPFLGERPGPLALLGMTLTVGGIGIVLLGRGDDAPANREGSVAIGILSGVLGALGQAVGYVLSSQALRGELDALSATVIRIGAAVLGVWFLALVQREVRTTLAALRDRAASAFMVGGAILGPFLGVTLSLVALQHIESGVAASITACYPILAILIGSRVNHERLTVRYLMGALIAGAGVVVLFLR